VNVIDSSAWLEYFADGPNAEYFARAIEKTAELVVPVICIYEVFKRILQQRSRTDALNAVMVMSQGRVVDLHASLAMSAAQLSLEHQMPLADSVILATARSLNATIWTQDADFESLPNVRFKPKA
jgi:predicted nucleic acid-binding protein